jgi:hypothetical protein
MRKEPRKLMAYGKELSKMPRDLELDDEALLGCFARAFDAWDNTRKVATRGELEKLANRWYLEMASTNLESQPLLDFMAKETSTIKDAIMKGTLTNPSGGPATGGRPGG